MTIFSATTAAKVNSTKPIPGDCWRCMSAEHCPKAATCRRNSVFPWLGVNCVMMTSDPGPDCADYWPEEAA